MRRTFIQIPGALDLTFLMKMYGMEGFDHLKDAGIYAPAGAGD